MSADHTGNNEAAQDSLHLADQLCERLVCGVIVVDNRGKVELISEEAAKILDLRAEAAASKSLEALPGPLQQMAREIAASGEAIARQELQLSVESRGTFTVAAKGIALPPGRSESSVALFLNDLTCAKRLEGNIRQLDRLASIGTLAAGLGHEIKNALVAGKTFIDLLLEKNQDLELVEVVGRELRRIDAIAGQMLRLASPVKASFGPIRVHEILDHSLRLMQRQLEGRGIALHRSYQAASDLIGGDDYQLEQAFLNLFLNALEAMGNSGELFVTTQATVASPEQSANGTPNGQQKGRVQISIRDTGMGIAPQDMMRLFQPFFSTKQNGTGLGLLITRRIIQEHRGTISVQSEPNQGATFNIEFPALGKSSEGSA